MNTVNWARAKHVIEAELAIYREMVAKGRIDRDVQREEKLLIELRSVENSLVRENSQQKKRR